MKHVLRFRHHSPAPGGGNLTVQPLTTVCSWCGRRRDDKGNWFEFTCPATGERLSHTACPTCYADAIPGMIREIGEAGP